MNGSKIKCLSAIVFFMAPIASNADPIVNGFGLTDPDTTITFDEIILGAGDIVTNQYASHGVTFSGVQYCSQGCPTYGGIEGIDGKYVGNNGGEGTNPFSVFFNSPVVSAAMGFATDPATTYVSAYLNGVFVETFSLATTYNNSGTAFLGFTNITFNEIRFKIDRFESLIDNIQFKTASVPEPGPLALLGLGLAGIGFAKRKKV